MIPSRTILIKKTILNITKWQILDSSKLEEIADDNLKLEKNDWKLS